MNATQGLQAERAHLALKVFGASLRWAGVALLALGVGYVFGLPLQLPFDAYSYYLIAFCGCLMVGFSLFVSAALGGADTRSLLGSAALTLLLFAGMRIVYLVGGVLAHEIARPLLAGEILLFGGVAVVFLLLRKRV